MSNVAHIVPPGAPATPPASTVGRALADARKAQGLSVVEVANRLKLSVSQVQALEAGEYDRLPGPVFVRGFTRNYARLLKLDADAAVHAVDAFLPHASPEEQSGDSDARVAMPDRSTSRWRIVGGIAVVVFLGAALVDILWPEAPPSTAVAPRDATAPSPVAPETQAPSQPPAADAAPAAANVAAPGAEPASAPQPPAAPTVAEGEGRGDASRTTLKAVFAQQSWVQVRDGKGEIVMERLYAPGDTRELAVQPPLELIIGNAKGVELTYGGRPVDLAPHTRGAVARLKLQ